MIAFCDMRGTAEWDPQWCGAHETRTASVAAVPRDSCMLRRADERCTRRAHPAGVFPRVTKGRRRALWPQAPVSGGLCRPKPVGSKRAARYRGGG
eukprot:415355-Prorocentrum_minimum.AAC.1